MTIYDGKLTGPFVSEQQFKQAVIRFWKAEDSVDDILEVENEEKESGMPNALVING
jgi:hypothetical protein